MQPQSQYGTRVPEGLLESGINHITESIARGHESLGFSHPVSWLIGELFTGCLLVMLVMALLPYFPWIGSKIRPSKGKKKHKNR